MKQKKINKKKGILFWITGLSGSGKTSLAKKIKKDVSKKYGPTIVISGDNLRSIFHLNKYDYKSRLSNMQKFIKFSKFVTDQKINIIFAVVGLIEKPRVWSRKNIDNYIEIYVKSDIKKIIKSDKKKLYRKKKQNNIVGINIKPEFPKKYNIIIRNNFNNSINKLSKDLLKKIHNLILN
jgi:adenylylsulfate kinase-like enzyme